MKKTSFKILCAALALLMILSAFAACRNKKNDETTASTEAPVTESQGTTTPEESSKVEESTGGSTPGGNETTVPGGNETTTPGGNEATNPGGGNETTAPGDDTNPDGNETTAPKDETTSSKDETTSSKDETTEESNAPVALDPNYGELIELSNGLANGVNPYFTDASQEQLTIENQLMNLGYGMKGLTGNMQVQHLSNKNGVPYIENTMDIVLNMKNGQKYYASKSVDSSILNIYRYGYYFYETRIEGQTFKNDFVREKELKMNLNEARSSDMYSPKYDEDTGILSVRHNHGVDPQIRFYSTFNAADYDYLQFNMRVEETKECSIYINANGSWVAYDFTSVASDEFVTYTINLAENSEYTGEVICVRMDINGSPMTIVELTEVALFKASYNGAPDSLTLQRTFFTYSNKLHHLLQLSTATEVGEVESVDMVTKIDADTVAALIVKDKSGLKYTLDDVDWESVEFVGFDIKDAGIFGFILPIYDETVYKNLRHEGVGTLKVTLEGGVYTVTQTKVPNSGKLVPSAQHTLNGNDFYMGQRIYTDENHTFDEFVKAAAIERNPLTSENITVDNGHNSAAFVAYDPIRGSYVFTLTGAGFSNSFYLYPNRQHRVSITVVGDELDREMYFMTHMSDNGCLESAALLGNGDLLLPVPIEVCKNFSGDGENTIYNLDDANYAETYFPMVVKANESKQYAVVHAYQNWGIFPLKQISSIQYHTPFYHLSTGVTETNCIVPFPEAGPLLSDHRAMSAPFWKTQPQHTSGGSHVFLHYTNADGVSVLSNTTYAKIDSYGPTYCDIDLGYISSDSCIEAEYTHMEFPQTDENRAFYEFTYEFKEDVSFKNFKKDFKFYRCTSNATGTYSRIGYLDENNKSRVVDASYGTTVGYVLGDNSPYFTFFDMRDCAPDTSTHTGYVNISYLIKDAEIICGGEKITPNFYINNYMMGSSSCISLSLNLDEVTFKKGDTIKINAILMPWGSQLLNDGIEDIENGQYEYTSVIGTDENGDPIYYMDKNVRDVRENTLLNPFTATPVKNAESMESVWIPKIKTTNGKSAEFTVTGGNNNCVVRVYGFNKLTSPVIQEKVNGKWTTYRIASASNRDDRGYGYFYDGYMVHYDGDGTYSYSFVIPMDNGAARTFRVTAEEDFKAWPTVPYDNNNKVTTEGDPLKVYVDANELVSFKDNSISLLEDLILVEDEEDFPFARYFPKSGISEVNLTTFNKTQDGYEKLETTGKYGVIKYRIPADAPSKIENIQFWSSTEVEKPRDNRESYSFSGVQQDGEWHVIIIDLYQTISSFHPDDNGNFTANFFRIDLPNNPVDEGMYIDIAYTGLCDNLEEIYELNSDMNEVILVTGSGSEQIDPETGGPVNNTPLNVFISADKISSATSNLDIKSSTVMNENGFDFVRIEASPESNYEAFAYLFKITDPHNKKLTSTGQYVVFKYRLQSDSTVNLGGLEIFANTFEPNAGYDNGKGNTDYYMLNYDGEWHVVVMDMAKLLPDHVVADSESGEYLLQMLRVDFFSPKIGGDIYIDFAYIGIADSLEKIYSYASEEKEVLLLTSTDKETPIDPKTGIAVSPYENNTPLNLYFSAQEIYDKTVTDNYLFSSVQLMNDDGTYVRLNAGVGRSEGYKNLFDSTDPRFASIDSTGKYFVIKYRLPEGGKPEGGSSIQFYTYTVEGTPLDNPCRVSYENIIYDGEWHVLIIDITKMMNQASYPATDGKYKALFLRVDFYNGAESSDYYIDYAYVGFCDDPAKAYEFNKDMAEVLLVEGPGLETPIDPNTGNSTVEVSNWRVTFTDIMVNGERIGADEKTNEPINLGLGSRTFNTATSLAVAGRFFIDGGVKEYKYRVIGETTTTASFGAGSSKAPGVSDGDAYLSIAQGLGLDESSLIGVTFNGYKTFDLSAFRGQKVAIEMIAVTNSGEEIVIANLTNVNVPLTDA